MTFNESNTVEAFIRDRLTSISWEFIDHATLPRQPQDVLVEDHLRDALVRLNPKIAERPEPGIRLSFDGRIRHHHHDAQNLDSASTNQTGLPPRMWRNAAQIHRFQRS